MKDIVIRLVVRMADEQLALSEAARAAAQTEVAGAHRYTASVLRSLVTAYLPPSATMVRRWAYEEREAAEHYRGESEQNAYEATHSASVLDHLADKLETLAHLAASIEAG